MHFCHMNNIQSLSPDMGGGPLYTTACSLHMKARNRSLKLLFLSPRGVEGQRVLEATLTMMTETGEVASSLWDAQYIP
jgi:hypothetical protein